MSLKTKLVLLLFVVLVLSLAVGCAQQKYKPSPHSGIGVEFTAYVEHFEATYDLTVTTPIGFSEELEGNTVGVCTRSGPNRWITIDRSFWDSPRVTDTKRLALIYHELIHCEFDFHGHINDRREDGCPVNFMSEYLPSDYCFDKYYDSYLNYWQ